MADGIPDGREKSVFLVPDNPTTQRPEKPGSSFDKNQGAWSWWRLQQVKVRAHRGDDWPGISTNPAPRQAMKAGIGLRRGKRISQTLQSGSWHLEAMKAATAKQQRASTGQADITNVAAHSLPPRRRCILTLDPRGGGLAGIQPTGFQGEWLLVLPPSNRQEKLPHSFGCENRVSVRSARLPSYPPSVSRACSSGGFPVFSVKSYTWM